MSNVDASINRKNVGGSRAESGVAVYAPVVTLVRHCNTYIDSESPYHSGWVTRVISAFLALLASYWISWTFLTSCPRNEKDVWLFLKKNAAGIIPDTIGLHLCFCCGASEAQSMEEAADVTGTQT